ncbi:unnamed protein product [Closterium sp. NIES-53]
MCPAAQRLREHRCPAPLHALLPCVPRTRPDARVPRTPCCPACLACVAAAAKLLLLLALPSAIALPCPATLRLARASAPRVAARPSCVPLAHAASRAPMPCRAARDLPCRTACALPTHCHRTVCKLHALLSLHFFTRCTAHAVLPCRELQPTAAAA